MDNDELAIWWVSENDCRVMEANEGVGDFELLNIPEYVERELRSRYGRAGRGRLWCPEGIKVNDLDWPEESLLAEYLGRHCGGIVFYRRDIKALWSLPGVFTDTAVKRIG